MIRDTVIVDLDGTLANIMHRIHFIEGKKRDNEGFYGSVAQDGVNRWCLDLIQNHLRSGLPVVIVSARAKECEYDTIAWLRRAGLDPLLSPSLSVQILRPNIKDNTPDVDLKREWLRSYGKERILFAVDDRARVVKLWRAEGITCLQCSDWEERQKEQLLHDAMNVLGAPVMDYAHDHGVREHEAHGKKAVELIMRYLGIKEVK